MQLKEIVLLFTFLSILFYKFRGFHHDFIPIAGSPSLGSWSRKVKIKPYNTLKMVTIKRKL